MQSSVPCPVPPEQRPLQEYEQLRQSWFFSWPTDRASPGGAPAVDPGGNTGENPGQHSSHVLSGATRLGRALALSWVLALGPSLLVASGSLALSRQPWRLGLAGAVAAVVLPLLLLLRQWLGWTYVHRRLVAEQVDYEESGWYDGQVWEKPAGWRQQDLLVARHQVQPVLARLIRSMAIALGLVLVGAGLCQAL